MNIIKRNINKIIILALVIITISGITLKYYLENHNTVSKPKETVEITKKIAKKEATDETKEDKETKIFVDIKGAIKKPGVYEIESTKKVIDVVYMAGGLTDEADTTLINLAKKLTDEMVIIIYTKAQIQEAKKKDFLSTTINDTCVCPAITNDACINNNTKQKSNTTKSNESTTKNSQSSTSTATTTEKININTATLEQLQTLSGIGASKAQAIIDYREENGNFTSIEDIKNVSGIGEAAYEKIKNNITV